MKRAFFPLLVVLAAVAVLAMTPAETEAQCANCSRCSGGHEAPAGSGDAYAAPHSDCIGGLWCTGHPACGVTYAPLEKARQGELNDLLYRAEDGDFAAVLAMLKRFPEHAYVNNIRNAVQVRPVLDCEEDPDRLIGHIPLDETQVAIAIGWLDLRRLTDPVVVQ